MGKFDYIFLSAVYMPIFPILFFLIGWWGSLPFIKDNRVFVPALLGLVLGIITSIFFWKKWMTTGYRQNIVSVILVYFFYSIGIYGFFMGFPVFNIFLGVFAGFYIIRRSITNGADKEIARKSLTKTAWFCVLVLFFACLCTAYFALSEETMGSQLEKMFSLNFKVTKIIIYGIIVIGGLLLLALQYVVVVFSGMKTLKYFSKK